LLSEEDVEGGGAVGSLPEYDLTRDSPSGWTWSATLPAPAQRGHYALAVYAAYPDAATDKLAEPVFAAFLVGAPSGVAHRHWTRY